MKTLTIHEVSQLCGVSTHTLRFWERELEGLIVPRRTKGGQRRYASEHILMIEDIKTLKGKGLSLTDIRDELNRRHNCNGEDYDNQRAEVLANKIAEIVRAAIFNFLNGKTAKE
jgi:DNA-binding transcriptional MerR regulator